MACRMTPSIRSSLLFVYFQVNFLAILELLAFLLELADMVDGLFDKFELLYCESYISQSNCSIIGRLATTLRMEDRVV